MKQYEFGMIPVPRGALAAVGISRNATVEAFADGKSLVIRRVPEEDFCEPQAAQTVTVKAGQTAEVFFANQLKRGTLEVVKTAEDGFVQNVRFRLFGTADCGQSVDEYAETDESGLAVFDRIPIGSDYTLAEVGAPERYVELAPQAVRIAWNAVTRQTVENRLIRGSIRGSKVSEAETLLPGAVFGLFAEGTTEFTRGNCAADGRIGGKRRIFLCGCRVWKLSGERACSSGGLCAVGRNLRGTDC